jgi:hypothetical protein
MYLLLFPVANIFAEVCVCYLTENFFYMTEKSGERKTRPTSCNMLLAFSDILSNSSIQQMPLSLKTSAPLSRTYKITSSISTSHIKAHIF